MTLVRTLASAWGYASRSCSRPAPVSVAVIPRASWAACSRSTSPDLYAAEQDIIAENDLVLVRLIVTAIVKGSQLAVPADGKPVRWGAYDVYRVTDGKISEEWAGDDIATIMTQIGAFSPP